jgi:hypothetical protein
MGALLVAVPTAAFFARVAVELRHWQPATDLALLELSVEQALRGAQLLGPYSRFGWNHPGPLYFYLLAPLYALTGRWSASLSLSVLLVNVGALVGTIAVFRRFHGGVRPTLATAVVLTLYGAFLGPSFLYNTWNPAVTLLPFLLLLALCAGIAIGDGRCAVAASVVFSFEVQTHVAYLVPGTIALAVGWASMILGEGRRRWRRPALGTVVALAVCWALPILEQLTSQRGNLAAIVRYMATRHGEQAWPDALAIVVHEMAWLLRIGRREPIDAPFSPASRARFAVDAVFVVALLAVVVTVLVRRRRDGVSFARALAVVSGACLLASPFAITRIEGVVLPYLTQWVSALAAAMLCAVALGAERPLQAADREGATTMLRIAPWFVLGTAAACAAIAPVAPFSQWPHAKELATDLSAQTQQGGPKTLLLRAVPPDGVLAYPLAGVALQLEKMGIPFTIARPLEILVPPRWRESGTEAIDIEFRVVAAPDGTACAPYEDGLLCATAGGRPRP